MVFIMNEIVNIGQNIELSGKSGRSYRGKILDKGATILSDFPAIVCLTHSHYADGKWHHHMRNIYHVDHAKEAVEHFEQRDDIGQLILIPQIPNERNTIDPIRDLIQSYLHQ